MLSYQHAYHAGNPADVLKHSVWAHVLTALVAKPKPLVIMETHAARGVYPVTAPETARLAEYKSGLATLPWAKNAEHNPYFAVVKALNPEGALHTIPGSPAVAQALLRETPEVADHLHLCEAHPTEFTHLETWRRSLTTHWQNVHIHQADGHTHIPALVRAGQRTVVMIDPSYEVKTEYAQTAATAHESVHRNPHATVVVWFPILGATSGKTHHKALINDLKDLNIQATHLTQWLWGNPAGIGLVGSGQVVLNTPYGIHTTLANTVHSLATLLKIPRAATTATWLVPPR